MKQINRLDSEKSLYLKQHADNPVFWYPWGDEAFAEARRSNKPIMLSIGYSACHWCHVMAHESFEDQETADFLNKNFTKIKMSSKVDYRKKGFVNHNFFILKQKNSKRLLNTIKKKLAINSINTEAVFKRKGFFFRTLLEKVI